MSNQEQQAKLLWVDDEIDLLRSQIFFLENKGYAVDTASNGADALELCDNNYYDVVFLDETMPGMGGLDTLAKLKEVHNHLPVVMITKNEEEDLMDSAIGAQISDYLIKPVNPKQILLTLKRILNSRSLVKEATASAYQQEFAKIFSQIQSINSFPEWAELYKKLVYWELELSQSKNPEMDEVYFMQKSEANNEFSKFISKRYMNWMVGSDSAPIMSHNIIKQKLIPAMKEKPTVLLVLDNLRFDQYKILEPILQENFRVENEDLYCSIVPTATQYCRNAFFAGLTPLEIRKRYPKLWKEDNEEGGKNMYEAELFENFLKRNFIDLKWKYHKITNVDQSKYLIDQANLIHQNDLTIVVYNFVDMLSHARTDMKVLKELAPDEKAYRSITESWFRHSPLLQFVNKITESGVQLFITTDHGSVRVQNPVKVIGDRETATNLRYKVGKNLKYNHKEVFEMRKPEEGQLSKPNLSSSYIFAKNNDYFVYPNNYNHYANFYKDTFQHGGISMEEMIIPFIQLSRK